MRLLAEETKKFLREHYATWFIPIPPASSPEPDPSPEDTAEITTEKPKPPTNPFYPKSRNPE